MKKQSFISKKLTSILCIICHSKYEKSSTRSTEIAKKVNRANKKSYYRPLGFEIIKMKSGECSVELTKPRKVKSNKVIFHIHGGSFKMKLNDLYRREAVFYSKLFGRCVVYSVDYRVYPDVRFPVPLEDVYNAFCEIANSGINPEDIIVIGDSCGANMAASLCLMLKDNMQKLPNKLVLFSFWGDASNSGDSYRKNCYRDPFYGIPKRLSFNACEDKLRRITLYAQGQDLYDPYLSPCFGDFSGFPETVLVTGSADISQSDSLTAYEKMKDADVTASLLNYDNMFHDFQLLKFLPESREVFRKVIEIVKK